MNEIAEQIFELLPNNGTTLSGSQIKATLMLRDTEYKAAKQELKDSGLVILGRGRSGTMALAQPGTGSDSPINVLPIGERASEALWAEVEKRVKNYGCKCGLVPNMQYEELIELEEGCTGSRQVAERNGTILTPGIGFGYVCPTLDYYRQKMSKFKKEESFDEVEI